MFQIPVATQTGTPESVTMKKNCGETEGDGLVQYKQFLETSETCWQIPCEIRVLSYISARLNVSTEIRNMMANRF